MPRDGRNPSGRPPLQRVEPGKSCPSTVFRNPPSTASGRAARPTLFAIPNSAGSACESRPPGASGSSCTPSIGASASGAIAAMLPSSRRPRPGPGRGPNWPRCAAAPARSPRPPPRSCSKPSPRRYCAATGAAGNRIPGACAESTTVARSSRGSAGGRSPQSRNATSRPGSRRSAPRPSPPTGRPRFCR